MSTERQKQAARRNLVKARRAQSERAEGQSVPRSSEGMSTADENRLDDDRFGIDVEADDWRDLFAGGKARKH